MKLTLQDFGTLVVNSATAVQAASAQVMDLRTGSVLRALLEANASIALWMQWLLVRLLRNSRAATSTGGDLDSWMADFGFTRLPPSRARGIVTLSRFDSSGSISVPAGLRVRTTDGTQSFVVVADATSANWSSDAGGFLLAAGSDSIDVPVEAEVPGRAGNVRASTITLIASNVPGIDSASNMLPTTGGADAESD
ncbi:MAG: baseplate J/gp47 family protein, partial [Rhodospirillales bacterium]|nr:baseplate J/gp47 family protein [Rhodospirillales bacterium]